MSFDSVLHLGVGLFTDLIKAGLVGIVILAILNYRSKV
jgi:hypothetical protein